jgi:hypothetical protein
MNDDFDELDRALFALPLEEPPAGLRQSILNATIYAPVQVAIAPVVVPPVVRPWEVSLVGGAVAIALWLVYALVTDKSFGPALTASVVNFARGFSDPTTLVWLGAGGAIAAWLVLFNAIVFRLPLRGARS